MNGTTLFIQTRGLQAPWVVHKVKLGTAAPRIDLKIICQAHRLDSLACGAGHQPVHSRLTRFWRHLNSFQYEAWLLRDPVPCWRCSGCGKIPQAAVFWAHLDWGFTTLFEASALVLSRELLVRQVSALLCCQNKQLWRRMAHYVGEALEQEVFDKISLIGIDEITLRRKQSYITVMRDVQAKRLLFATRERNHQTILDFMANLEAHSGAPADKELVCLDIIGAAYAKARRPRPRTQISFNQFHVMQMALQSPNEVRRQDLHEDSKCIRAQPDAPPTLAQLMRDMRCNSRGWNKTHSHATYWLQRSSLKMIARARRLKMILQQIHAQAGRANDGQAVRTRGRRINRGPDIADCRRSRRWPDPCVIDYRLSTAVRGMLEHRFNACAGVIDRQLRLTKRRARGFETSKNFNRCCLSAHGQIVSSRSSFLHFLSYFSRS